VPADILRYDVEVENPGLHRRGSPEVGCHTPGFGSDEEHQIGLADHLVGARTRVTAEYTNRQWIRRDERLLAVERRGNRDLEAFVDARQLSRRSRKADTP